MQSKQLLLFFVFLCNLICISNAEESKIVKSATVDVGDNQIAWEQLDANKEVTLEVTFLPKNTNPSNMFFISKTACGVTLGGLMWVGNYTNTHEKASFKSTLPADPDQFKCYPTLFSGQFAYPKGVGIVINKLPDNSWHVSGALQVSGEEHSFFRITRQKRANVKSGISVNGKTNLSDFNLKDMVKVEYVTFDHTPKADDTVKDVYDSAVKKMSATYSTLAKGNEILTPSFCVTNVNANSEPGKKNQIYFDTIKSEPLENLRCEYKDTQGNGPNPECNRMLKVTRWIKIEADFEYVLHIPKWKQADNARKEAKEQWNGFVKNVLVKHEEQHCLIFLSYLSSLCELEKNEYTFDLCNNKFSDDNFIAVHRNEESSLRQEMSFRNERLDTPEEYQRIDDLVEKLNERLK